MSNKVKNLLSDFRTYWNIPMPGRYMTFKEIAAYAGGGIGAYFIITMGQALAVGSTNMIVGDAIGVSPTHAYILYIIATLANIPLTAIRATMVDNTRNKAGKYRPYLVSMGIPTALIAVGYVWFPYDALYNIFPMQIFGQEGGYVAKCAVVLIFNLLLQFFYNFFYDAYTNLIHVLSPNTQERTDVLAIKSVVYSLAPSIVNMVLPIVAQFAANDDLYDIRVYRYTYPIFAILGVGLTILVFGYTKEKIVQAKTRVVQVRFIDAFKTVAKNKYFWIIALAGWLGFLESAYGNILTWSYTYGHTTSGTMYSLIFTVVCNASLWGMILAPFCIRIFGKKNVLIGINLMNVLCILAIGINMKSIIWIAACVYVNYLFGAFEQITSPAIQADIRDYHQYKTGERIDGMFATVQTIGNIVTLLTSAVLPFVYERYGIYEGNGYASPYDILDVDTGEAGLLYKVMGVLVIMAAVGAFLNVVPYFFYDLTEKQHKGIVRILKIRAMFEDYGNGIRNNDTLVEAIDIIREARVNSEKELANLAELKKTDKKAYKAAKTLNEEIEISKVVCAELVKFSDGIGKVKLDAYKSIYDAGLKGLYNADKQEILCEISKARELPGVTKEEKEIRSFCLEFAKQKLSSRKAIDKYYKSFDSFVQPDFANLDNLFEKEESIEAELKELYAAQQEAKKAKNSFLLKEISEKLKSAKAQKKQIDKQIEAEMNQHAYFGRAAKVYLLAERVVKESENMQHFDEIARQYDDAKKEAEMERQALIEEQKRLEAEKAAAKEAIKAEKEAVKSARKN